MTYLMTGRTGVNGSEVVRELVKLEEELVIFDVAQMLKSINDVANQVEIISGGRHRRFQSTSRYD